MEGERVMRFRRRTSLSALAVALATVLAGCGSGPAQSSNGTGAASHASKGPIDLVYWAGHASGALHAAVVAEVAQFNKTHSGIHVTFVATGASKHGLAAFEAGTAPNVGMVSSYIVPQLTQAHALLPLNSYIKGKNGLTAAQIRQDYYPAVWADMKLGSSTQYMMPLEKKSLLVIYYNESLLKKAGIKTPPTSWAEVGADAAKITALGKGYHGIAWTPSLRQLFTIISADGGKVFATNANRSAYAMAYPQGIAALSMLSGWVQSGSMILTTGYQYQLDFGTGDVGMLIDASAGYTYDKGSVGGKFVMGGVPAPVGSSGHSSQYINGASLVMFNVGTAAQKAASWTFVKWMSSPSTNTYWNEHTNYLPLGPAGYRMMKGFYAKHPAQAASFSNPAYWWFKPRAHVSGYEASKTPLDAIELEALQGKISVQSALEQMDRAGTSYLAGKTRE